VRRTYSAPLWMPSNGRTWYFGGFAQTKRDKHQDCCMRTSPAHADYPTGRTNETLRRVESDRRRDYNGATPE
jgi:hypothetical protein